MIDTLSKFAPSMPSASGSADAGRPKLDDASERAARLFVARIEGTYALRAAIVFGSRARGDHETDSDTDLALVLDGARGNRSAIAADMAALAFDVMLETDVLIDPLPLWESELRKPELFGNPKLIEHIERDGRRL